jgi:hypothetical protein
VLDKVLTGIAIISVIIIFIVSLFDINKAVQIGVDAIIAAVIIGILVYIGRLFTK